MTYFYYLVISPIETIIDWIFNFITGKISAIGIMGAITGVSLSINFLALPLYNVAEAIQESQRLTMQKLNAGIKRIKTAFKGDEQFMMLSNYYRINHYHPIFAFKSSLSILIEIPFFIAAYHYLSHNSQLSNASWWIFNDLGKADSLFAIGNFSINILPIIMTAINLISGTIYTKDAPVKEKVQLYAMAALFLVLLYNSPSGLVLYWILNNLFSLIKNIVLKLKNPKKVLQLSLTSILVLISSYFLIKKGMSSKTAILLVLSILAVFLNFYKLPFKIKEKNIQTSYPILILSGVGLSLLCGCVIPSGIISTSPEEFYNLGNTVSPVSYIFSSFFIFAGFFIFWPLVTCKMFGTKTRYITQTLLTILSISAVFNVYVFANKYGDLSVSLSLSSPNSILINKSFYFVILPVLVTIALSTVIILSKNKPYITSILSVLCLTEAAYSAVKINGISQAVNNYSKQQAQNLNQNIEHNNNSLSDLKPVYQLSKTEQNVIFLFMDRAINKFFLQAVTNDKELKEQFAGFTFYPNTVSYSNHTIIGSAAMMGGDEYSPVKMNERKTQFLRDKHNEAILLLPKLFSDKGYSATVSNAPDANYSNGDDFSAFESYKGKIDFYYDIGKYKNSFIAEQKLEDGYKQNTQDNITRKGFINFALLNILYPPLRVTFYNITHNSEFDFETKDKYYKNISNLYYLPKLTTADAARGGYIFIGNETPHSPITLDTNYLTARQLQNDNIYSNHYDVNIATFRQLGKFFDYLRENDVYDNTKIVIVSDHGYYLQFDKDFKNQEENASYYALLLEKDFNQKNDLEIDWTFKTNSDAFYFLYNGMNLSKTNPFTGTEIKQENKTAVTVYETKETEKNPFVLKDSYQFTLDKSRAWHVKDNIFKKENWVPLNEWETRQ